MDITEGTLNSLPAYPYFAIAISNFKGHGTYVVGGTTHLLMDSNYLINTAYGSVTISIISPNIIGTLVLPVPIPLSLPMALL